MNFSWDAANREHLARHNVSPEEVEQVIHNDPIELAIQDVDGEIRTPLIGETDTGRILVVISTQRQDVERIITAWDATKTDKAVYLQHRIHQTWRPE